MRSSVDLKPLVLFLLIYSLGSIDLTTLFPHFLHVPSRIRKPDFIAPFIRFMQVEPEQVLHHTLSRMRGWMSRGISSQRFLAFGVNCGNGIVKSCVMSSFYLLWWQQPRYLIGIYKKLNGPRLSRNTAY